MSTRKPLHYYLENTDRLNEISLDSLRDWSMQYPSAENIKLLIAKKCEQLGLRDDMEPYYRAAASTNDRRRLYEVLQDVNIYVVPDQEEELAIPDPMSDSINESSDQERISIDQEESVVEALGIENSAIAVNGNGKHHSNDIQVDEKIENKDQPDQEKSQAKGKKGEVIEAGPKKKEPKKNRKKKAQKLHKAKDKGRKTSKTADNKERKKSKKKKHKKQSLITADPNSPYTKWLLELRGQYDDTEPYEDLKAGGNGKSEKSKKRKKKSKKTNKAHRLASKSIKKQEDIVSEPLAALLVAQGHLEEAKEMYSKLSLIFPEKNSFFAAEIEKIKQKLEL